MTIFAQTRVLWGVCQISIIEISIWDFIKHTNNNTCSTDLVHLFVELELKQLSCEELFHLKLKNQMKR